MSLAAWPSMSDGTGGRRDQGKREDPVLPHSQLPGRSTTMDKRLRRSYRLSTPDDRPSIEPAGRHRDQR
jgi:hypothetical protein